MLLGIKQFHSVARDEPDIQSVARDEPDIHSVARDEPDIHSVARDEQTFTVLLGMNQSSQCC